VLFNQATKGAMQRFEELQADELWKEQNCRICASDPARPFWHKHRDSRRARRMRCSVSEPIVAGPNCGKVVYKPDGCDKMICGRDADDKGGGNKQVAYEYHRHGERSAAQRPDASMYPHVAMCAD
jgi:hypothetical protein